MASGRGPGEHARSFGRAPPLRVPTTTVRSGADEKPRPADRPTLLLSVHRGTLSIELDQPFALGPITVDDLALALPSVRFPVDLTGGVSRFRHRRGMLTRLAISAEIDRLAASIAPRLRGVLGEGTPELGIVATDLGASVGMRLGGAALAFEVVVVPNERDVRLVPQRARGLGLGSPPYVLALRALAEVCRPFGRLAGSAVIVPDAVGALVRHVLPLSGARAPSVAGARWEAPASEEGRLSLQIDVSSAPPALAPAAIRAIEQAELTADADAIAASGDLDEARRRYLLTLERAPRHPEISSRIAWIDVVLGERHEAALSTLVDAMPAVDAGLLGGALLAAIGDDGGATAAYARAAHAEAFAPLAALAWLEVSRLASELGARLDALDHAVARSPSLEEARWERLAVRLDVGDAAGARADAEHLEAAARGPEARHRIWSRAADAFLSRGYVVEARALFERALRYAPESAEAVLGLALSLRAAGEGRRALDLLARASALATRAGRVMPSIEIELAQSLVEHASDRPAAIARVRAIPPGLRETALARSLEGRWRAELGDLAGASLALARLREAAEHVSPEEPDRAAAVAAMLVEAADIEENARGDLRAAQRHLSTALRLRPRDRHIGAAFRRIASELGRAASPPPLSPPLPPPSSPEDVPASSDPTSREIASSSGVELAPPSGDDLEGRLESDELLADRLTERLRADPHDHAVALELADVLTRLGRDLELFALLSARIEEGGEEVRRELWPRRREVLSRLAIVARAEGRPSEADLYEMMADAED